MPRLFTALDIPDEIQHQLSTLMPRDSNIRPQNQPHITLHYIGNTSDPISNAIHLKLLKIKSNTFHQNLSGVGIFAKKKNRHILWSGVEKCDGLVTLHKAIGRALLSIGLTLEKRNYHPHITIARLSKPNKILETSYLESHATFKAEFDVTSFSLYASESQEGRIRYTKLHEYTLYNYGQTTL